MTKAFADAIWRPLIGVAVLISALKSSPLNVAFPQVPWEVLQFAPILAVSLAQLVALRRATQTSRDWLILGLLSLFALTAMLTTLASVAPSRTLQQALILVLMIVFLSITYWQRWRSAAIVFGDLAIVFCAVVVTQLVGLVSAALGFSWPFAADHRFVGLVGNANYAGMLSAVGSALGVCLFLRATTNRARAVFGGASLVLLLSLALSNSRGSVTGLALGVILSLAAARAWRTLGVVAAVGSIILVTLLAIGLGPFGRVNLTDVTSGRAALWGALLDHWRAAPIFGTGYRTIELLKGTGGLSAHNVFIWVLTETGIIGFVIFVSLLIAILWRGGFTTAVGIACCVIVIELTESTLFGWGGPAALVFWLCLLGYAASAKSINLKPKNRGNAATLRPKCRIPAQMSKRETMLSAIDVARFRNRRRGHTSG